MQDVTPSIYYRLNLEPIKARRRSAALAVATDQSRQGMVNQPGPGAGRFQSVESVAHGRNEASNGAGKAEWRIMRFVPAGVVGSAAPPRLTWSWSASFGWSPNTSRRPQHAKAWTSTKPFGSFSRARRARFTAACFPPAIARPDQSGCRAARPPCSGRRCRGSPVHP